MNTELHSAETKTRVRNIILAEDDVDDQNIFQIALQEVDPDINLEFASNGRQLLELLNREKPDLLFLDLEMPYKNGLECLVEIRDNEQLSVLPVIVFSSTTKQSNIQTAYEMGAHLFFIKPPVFKDYLSSIRSILHLDWKNPEMIRERFCNDGRYSALS